MYLLSSAPPPYLPEAQQTSVLRLGLLSLNPAQWLVFDQDFETYYQNKLAARSCHAEGVYQALPESLPAQRELRSLLVSHLLAHHCVHFGGKAGRLQHPVSGGLLPVDDPSLWESSLWAAEDICLLQERAGRFLLAAASVCAPSNWKLEEKIGRCLDDIHSPVPDYGRQLSSRVNRLFSRLRPDKPLLRYNWSIQEAPELCWRGKSVRQKNDSDSLYWRVERQTLRRLPSTGAVVFTIRVTIHAIDELNRLPGFRDNLASLLQRLPARQAHYKNLPGRSP